MTLDEYQIVAKTLTFPTQALIEGESVSAISGKSFDAINPATGEVITELSACEKEDVDVAVASARKAFEEGEWSQAHPSERKEVLLKFAALIETNALELAVMESLDAGKPIADCLSVDVPETVQCIAWHAEAQDKIYDQIAPSSKTSVGMIVREPLGVVAAVLPWNFPMLMMAWKIGPALATGNSVVVKPAEQTSLTAIRLGELAIEAGVPKGVMNIVPGMGPTAGAALGLHKNVDALAFTGSTQVGRRFLEYAAQSNMKEVTLEMGGKSACIVLEDAHDLDRIAELQANAIFWNMGENCTANSRLIIHDSIYDELIEKLVIQAKAWKVGNPLDPETQIGPLVSAEHFNKVSGLVEIGKREGARVVCGGHQVEGLTFEPTIFADVTSEMTIFKEEIFGPVLAVIRADSDEEALRLANDSEYGLGASLYTQNLNKAHEYSRRLHAGMVSINSYSEGEISTPFGGFKASGFGGKDNGVHAHDQYTELKTIWIELSGSQELNRR